METANQARQLAIYLDVHIDDDMPDGTGPNNCDLREITAGRSMKNILRKCTPGSAVEAVAKCIVPRNFGPGEWRPDGRCGRQAALALIVEAWPRVPLWLYQHAEDLREAFGGTHWIAQGKQWDRLEIDGRAVYDAIVGGAGAADVKAKIAAGSEQFGRRVRVSLPSRSGRNPGRLK